MREIGVGVVGWGFMGKTHTHALREMGLFYQGAGFRPKLQCICTRRLEVARQAARDGGFARYTDSFDDMLAMPDIEVVSICTPNALHREMAVKALNAGKHVYIDKPLAMNAQEARDIQQAVRRSGKLLQVVHNNRFFPSTLRARELVEEGRIGQVLSFRCDYLHSGSVDPNRPVGWKMMGQGGVLLDLASHAADLVVHLAGPVAEVLCETRILYPQRPTADGGATRDLGEDQVLALMRLENGALGALEASKIATGTDDELSFEIYGDRGALRWRLMQADYLEFYDNTQPDAPLGGQKGFTRIACGARYPWPGGQFLPVKNTVGWDRSHMHCYFRLLDAVAHGGPVSPDVDEAVALHDLMDAMARSQRERRWVRVHN